MMRCVQIGNVVVVMTGKERDGKLTLDEMRIIPNVIYNNIEKGFRYEEVH